MIWCLLLQFIFLIHSTIENEIIIITDVEKNISSLYVHEFNTRVYCTANEEPIKLDNTCTYASQFRTFQITYPDPVQWNDLPIHSNKIKRWWDSFSSIRIILYLYTSQRNVNFEIYINEENSKFKTQKLNPFEWQVFLIDYHINFEETMLFNGTTLEWFDSLPITVIKRIRIDSDKLIFFKFGRGRGTMVPVHQNTFLSNIDSTRPGRFLQYDNCSNNYTLSRVDNDERIQMTKRDRVYIIPPVNGTLKLYVYSPCLHTSISEIYSCPYTDYTIYTFEYDPQLNISCKVDEKNITVKLRKSSNYTKDITSIASSIKGNYICTESSCYCKDGYQGDNCNLECEKNKWGKNCEKTCGKCLNMEDCDKINGECEQCQEGFINSTCKDFVDIEYVIYTKNETAAWIRWKIKNDTNHDVFLNIDGKQRKVNMKENCDLWSNYTNYICSFVNLTKPNSNKTVKFQINIDNKLYTIKSLNVYAEKEEPSESPWNLRQQDKKIIWNHPLITNGHIQGFLIKVTIMKSGFLENKSILKLIQVDKEKMEYGIQYNLVETILGFNDSGIQNVIQLAPATQYSITVRAFNSLPGKESNPLVITTELPTPITLNQIYDCGKEFKVTNLVRDSYVYLVKTVTIKGQIKSKSVQNASKLEYQHYSSNYHKIDETGLLTSRLGNQSRKITVQCTKSQKDTYFTVLVINRFNGNETHLLINIDRVRVFDELTLIYELVQHSIEDSPTYSTVD